MARIYTKGGDKGRTSLLSGQRVSKCNQYVDAYGVVDELQAQIGVLIATCHDQRMTGLLKKIQADLHTAMAQLALGHSPNQGRLAKLIRQDDVAWLESEIDRYVDIFPLPKRYVVPGASLDSAQAHVARTVCRRAERKITALPEGAALQMLLKYFNRLSDLLFTLAWGMELMALAKEALGINPEVKGDTYEYAPLHS